MKKVLILAALVAATSFTVLAQDVKENAKETGRQAKQTAKATRTMRLFFMLPCPNLVHRLAGVGHLY